MKSHAETLIEQPFFRGMSEADIRTVAECGKDVTFDKDTVIFRQNDVAVRFFVILEGTVSLEIQSAGQEPLTIQTLGGGSVLGWSWIFPNTEWKFNARAVEPIKAIVIDTHSLHGKIEQDQALGMELFRRFAGIMVERLQATRMQLMDIYRPHGATAAN